MTSSSWLQSSMGVVVNVEVKSKVEIKIVTGSAWKFT